MVRNAFIFIIIFIPFVGSHIRSVIEFLKNLESSEKPNFYYIFNIDQSEYADEIIRHLSLSRVSIKYGMDMNHLNFPSFKIVNSIKYHFNRDFAAIIIGKNLASLFNDNLFWKTIGFSRTNIIIFIFDNDNKTMVFINYFRQHNYINAIFLNIEEFVNTNTFQTYDRFPDYKVISTSKFFREDLRNLKHYPVKVICHYQMTFSKCFKKNNKLFGVGRTFYLIENFVKFINGTLDLKTRGNIVLHETFFDFWTSSEAMPLKEILNIYPMDTEMYSNVLDKVSFFLILPKPKFISSYLYIIKPFSTSLWILCFGYLVFGTIILCLTLKITNNNCNIWNIFNQFLGTLIGQSYLAPEKSVIFGKYPYNLRSRTRNSIS